MTEIVVDGSLLFRFEATWSAIDWDQAAERPSGHKTADIAAAGTWALLIEVKDDRIKATKDQFRDGDQ